MIEETSPLVKLFNSFKNSLPLNNNEREDLTAKIKQRRIKRKEFLLLENHICNEYSFVAEGCFRKFYSDHERAQRNVEFIAEGQWIMEIDSFYNEKPSRYNIQAIENSIIFQIKKEDLLNLFILNPKFDRNFRVIVENRFMEMENRILHSISSSAEERFHYFLTQYPGLSSRIPDREIAAYLGITPEFFSRMRKNGSLR